MADIDRIVFEIGEAGQRLVQLGALEGAAGNISVFVPSEGDGHAQLPAWLDESLAWTVPLDHALPPGVILITGTGRRLRDVAGDPGSTLCAIAIRIGHPSMLWRRAGSDVRPTSEIDSHIGIHAICSRAADTAHAIVHAQPPHLTWLSHIVEYREFRRLNRQLMRWQPETLVMLPEGIGTVPFVTPGTPEQGRLTTREMGRHRLVVWAKHGVVARSPAGPLAAADLIDYAEAAARYEVLDIHAGRQAEGISLQELRGIAARFEVPTDLLNVLPDRPL